MLAAGLRLRDRLDGVVAVIGAGCDGELTLDEVLDRIAALADARAWVGTFQIEPEAAEEILRAAEPTGTEASVQLARSALGERGEVEIRGGRRRLMLSPVSGARLLLRPRGSAAGAAARGGGARERDARAGQRRAQRSRRLNRARLRAAERVAAANLPERRLSRGGRDLNAFRLGGWFPRPLFRAESSRSAAYVTPRATPTQQIPLPATTGGERSTTNRRTCARGDVGSPP